MFFATRNNDGITAEHKTLEEAIEAFLADDGYRLDLIVENGVSLFVHRDDLEQREFAGIVAPGFYMADAKVLVQNRLQSEQAKTDNVIHVNFTNDDDILYGGFDEDEDEEIDYHAQMSHLIGKRVQLISLKDPYTHIEYGTLGTIDHIDDTGTLFVNWDNGTKLGLIPGVDQWKIIH